MRPPCCGGGTEGGGTGGGGMTPVPPMAIAGPPIAMGW